MNAVVRILGSCFGLGLLPKAPGTFGTLGGVAIAHFLVPDARTLLFVTLALAIAGTGLAALAEKQAGGKDPQWFVLDEVVGYLAVLIGLPFHEPWCLAAAFVAFRIFDITKPPPVRNVEQLPGGIGIMADDVVAAVYAHLLIAIPLKFF